MKCFNGRPGMLPPNAGVFATILLGLVVCFPSIKSSAFGGELEILLINDDGFQAEGIQILKERLEVASHRVTLVAPSGNASASSAGVNLGEVFVIELVDAGDDPENEYSVARVTQDGVSTAPVPATPVDCIIASFAILGAATPDLIVSGINSAHNTGRAANLSGTVGGAIGAATKLSPYGRIPTIAVNLEEIFLSDPSTPSAEFEKAYGDAADLVVRLVERLQGSAVHRDGHLLPAGIALNVNYPALPKAAIKGVRLTRQGDAYLVRHDEDEDGSAPFPRKGVRGVPLVISGDASSQMAVVSLPALIAPNEGRRNADTSALMEGYVTITPLDTDYTARGSDRRHVKRRIGKLGTLLDGDD